MKKILKNLFFSFSVVAVTGWGIVSCDTEDYTGYSTIVPTTPSLTVVPDFISPVTLTEDGSKHTFTVNLSVAQVVDVKLYIKQVGGDAISDVDYKVTPSIVIPAGSKTASGTIEILTDDVIEATETLILQIGDQTTANSALTPVTVTFNIGNLTSDDLLIGLSWMASTPATDDAGTPIKPTDLADMRMLITDSPYSEIIDGADGASFEDYTMLGTMDDGEYLIVADFYATMAAPVRDLDLSVSFSQLGVTDEFSYDFPAAINTGTVCPSNYFILAKIIKAGNVYTIEKVGANPPLTGAWFGIDTEFEYPSAVSTKLDCDGNYLIYGLCKGWIEDFWEETVVEEGDVVLTINTDGTVAIASQYAFTTDFKGTKYPYSISGTGTLDESGAFPVLTITYVLDQEGFNPSQYCFDNNLMDNNDFTATITLDPAGLPAAGVARKASSTHSKLSFSKPIR